VTKQYIILGMHRSRTSLVASVLDALGVNMGEDMLGAMQGNPYGHFESIDFLELNMDILEAAGGDWHNPPDPEEILAVEDQFHDLIRLTVQKYDQVSEQWGWKDPRTCLTIPLYHKHLNDPTYIITQRSTDEIALSLLKRHEPVYEFQPNHWYLDHWAELAHEYRVRIASFLNNNGLGAVQIDTSAFMDRRRAHYPINRLADMVDAKPQRVRHAFHRVRFER